MEHIFSRPFYEIAVKIEQKSEAKLPYYGPILRGWLRDAIYKNKQLLEILNLGIDVHPFFAYSSHKGNTIEYYLNFMGFTEKITKDIVVALSDKASSHLKGVDCKIVEISYKKKGFEKINLGNKFKVKFITPTAIYSGSKINIAPSLNDILKSTVRSANRFMKYYTKECYPYTANFDYDMEIESFNIKKYEWNHKNIRDTIIPLNGILGEVTFKTENPLKYTPEILTLTQFFQIGKWISYGLGKLEVENIK